MSAMTTARIAHTSAWVMFCVLAIGWLVCVAAFVNNLWVAFEWVSAVRNGDAARLFPFCPRGILSSLNWTSVDISTVSTFVPVLGLPWIMIALVRIGRTGRHQSLSLAASFPFWSWHDWFMMMLGLIGTVVGLIMLGYYPADTLGAAELIVCMRTALYSTLVALVWVVVVAAPIRPLLRAMYRAANDLPRPTSAETTAMIQSFKDSLQDTASALSVALDPLRAMHVVLSDINTAAARVREALDILKQRLGVDAALELKASCEGLAKEVKLLAISNQNLAAAANATKEALNQQGRQLQTLFDENTSLRKHVVEAETDRRDLRDRLKHIGRWVEGPGDGNGSES